MTTRDPDTVLGWVAALGGTGGLTIQWLTDFGSLFLIAVNILLAIGGGYLLYLRIIKVRQDIRNSREDD